MEEVSLRSAVKARADYETSDLRQRLAKYHKNVDATFWGWDNIWLDPFFRTWNLESYLPQIRGPVLLIQGEQDEYGTIAQLDATRARMPRTEVLSLLNCDHSPHSDHPETVLARITAFIAELAPAGVGPATAR